MDRTVLMSLVRIKRQTKEEKRRVEGVDRKRLGGGREVKVKATVNT